MLSLDFFLTVIAAYVFGTNKIIVTITICLPLDLKVLRKTKHTVDQTSTTKNLNTIWYTVYIGISLSLEVFHWISYNIHIVDLHVYVSLLIVSLDNELGNYYLHVPSQNWEVLFITRLVAVLWMNPKFKGFKAQEILIHFSSTCCGVFSVQFHNKKYY